MIAVTPWSHPIHLDDETVKAGTMEVRDIAQGFAGALFISLPLLFTMEMWQIARTIPDVVLLGFLVVSLIFNRLFLQFAGFRCKEWQRSRWWDALVTMGIGAVASTVTLYMAGVINTDIDTHLAIKTIALETVPTSMGAAVAVNQLGGGDSGSDDSGMSRDLGVIVGTVLGAFLFSFNIAPTMETRVIVQMQNWWQTGATFVLSIGVSYLMVSVAQFSERDMSKRKVINAAWLEALVSYLFAFFISMMLLWVFQYSTPMDPLEVWLPQTIVLAYVTTLGGAAGRLIL
ncbi:hypothetical protein CP97_02535 [Aurantiacibacter atlanticus]|uniref:Integral membrane protein n=1 Tax=Aurantiacibacter atlanticus TaxID=1648404 RepID=A0A0H4VVT9_9SPHN|nr:DUF2391 family protein [Aurantiacibacter atlanticus]AKQ41163.1 hypothetical protein CP97_02535 [Aurantiacibacter atlanticus]